MTVGNFLKEVLTHLDSSILYCSVLNNIDYFLYVSVLLSWQKVKKTTRYCQHSSWYFTLFICSIQVLLLKPICSTNSTISSLGEGVTFNQKTQVFLNYHGSIFADRFKTKVKLTTVSSILVYSNFLILGPQIPKIFSKVHLIIFANRVNEV